MRLEVLIDGMTAVHAKHAVFTALAGVPGLTRAEVELGRATLDAAAASDAAALRAAVAAAIGAAGFHVTAVRVLPRTLPTL
jgi:copper chaperone CopZ